MGKVMLKHTGYLTHIEKVISHAKYVGFRSAEIKEKGAFFSRNEERCNYKEFIKRIEAHRALRYSKAIKVQKLVFSLKEIDYNAYLRSGKSYKEIIRRTLEIYEGKHDVKLDWIANIHQKEDHPHCHVIIKAVSDVKDSEGKYKRIKFKKEDYKELREIFDKEFYKDVQYRPEELEKTLLDRVQQDVIMKDIAKGFKNVAHGASRDIEKQQREAEYERQRKVKLQVQKDKNKNNRER